MFLFLKEERFSKYVVNTINTLVGITLFVIPLFTINKMFLFPFVVTKTFLFLGIIEIILILYLVLILRNSEYSPKKNVILWSFFLFIASCVVSSFCGADPIYSFWSGPMRADGIIVIAHIFLFFLISSCTIKSRKILNRLMWVSVISATLSAILVYLGVAGFNIVHLFGSNLKGGLTGNESFIGVYLLFNLFFIFFLFLENENKKKQIILALLFILILFSPIFFNFDIFNHFVKLNELINNPLLILGNSRGVTVALLLGGILLFFLLMIKSPKKEIGSIFKILTGVYLTSLLVLLILLFIPETAINKWFNENTGGYRSIYISQAVEGFKEKPILGWGLNSFQIVNEKYLNPEIFNFRNQPEIYSDKVHNIIFDTIINGGLIGLATYLFLLVSVIFLLWKSENISYEIKSVFSCLLLSYFIQNLVFFDVLLSYIMFAFYLSVITILHKKQSPVDESNPFLNRYFFREKKMFFLICIIIFILGAISIRYFIFLPLKKEYKEYKFYILETPEKRIVSNKDDFSKISPFGKFEDSFKYPAYIYEIYYTNMERMKIIKDLHPYILDINGAILEIDKMESIKRKSEALFIKCGLLYVKYNLVNQGYNKLSECDQQKIVLYPKDIRGYLDYSEILLLKNRENDALNVLERAYIILPNNFEINRRIIDVVLKIGNKKLIDEKIRRAEKNLPGVKFE